MKRIKSGPRVLLADIETAPILAFVWGLFDQNVAINQIKSDWHLLSWSAKWLGDAPNKTMYMDQRNEKNIEDDSKILKGIWKLLDEADIVIWQNGRNFDHKKLNARFVLNGMKPPSSYKHIDTLQIAKKHFGFTSNKLEYMSSKLCKKYKKLKHNKFAGFEMWSECLKGNKAAWREMEKYNRYDVLALEELYTKLGPWETSINFHAYSNDKDFKCNCGSKRFKLNGFAYYSTGKFQRYQCLVCGAETRDRVNAHSKDKKKSIRLGTQR